METLDIVGMGVITVAGLNLQENWETLLKGESCIRKVRGICTEGLQTSNAGQIYLSDKELRDLVVEKIGYIKSDKRLPSERAELLLLLAFEEARTDAMISREELQQKRVGIFVGTSLSGFTRLEKEYQEYGRKNFISPTAYLTYPLHVCVDRLAFEYSISGPRYLFSTACSASLHAVFIAKELFSRDLIDIAVVGGAEPLSLMSLAGFSSLKSLAEGKCSPYSVTEMGISIGEGAGVLILKKNQNNPKYGSIINVAGSSDAYHPTASNPTGETIRICIEKALNGLDYSKGTMYYVMSHGTGTAHNDKVETCALKQIPALKDAYISAAKSVIGHTLGASGVIELIYLVKALQEKKALPIANFTEPRVGCDLNYVQGKPIDLSDAIGVKNAFAFGGNNVCVVVGNKNNVSNKKKSCSEDSSVVITGVGMVSPANVFDKREIVKKLAEGKTFIGDISPVRGLNRSLSVSRAALISDDVLEKMGDTLRIKNMRKMDRISQISCIASALALKDSGFKVSIENSTEVGLVSATGTGALKSVSDFYINMWEKGIRLADANVFPNTVVNAHLGYVSIELKIKGYSTVIAQGSSSPYAALNIGMYLLKSGICKAVLVGAVSEYCDIYHRALIDIGYVNNVFSLDSYSEDLQGNIIGEGGVFFVLERKNEAEKRGAPIYAIIEQVALDSEKCAPSRYEMEENPLKKILTQFNNLGIKPSYLAGEGNGLRIENDFEYAALTSFYPDVPKTSATPYFGMAVGVVPFYNLALFCLLSGSNNVLGVPHQKQSAYGLLLRGMTYISDLESILVGTVSPGGSAGAIFAKKDAP